MRAQTRVPPKKKKSNQKWNHKKSRNVQMFFWRAILPSLLFSLINFRHMCSKIVSSFEYLIFVQ